MTINKDAQARLEAAIAGGFWIVLTDVGPLGVAGADPHMTWDDALAQYQEYMDTFENAVVLRIDAGDDTNDVTFYARDCVAASYRAQGRTPPEWLEE